MKKMYLLFVMCLTTVMLSASGVELPHKAKMSPVMKKAVMDTVSPGYGLGGAQDTIRLTNFAGRYINMGRYYVLAFELNGVYALGHFEYLGDFWGDFEPRVSDTRNSLEWYGSGETIYFGDFATTIIPGEDRQGVVRVEGMGSDGKYYIVEMNFAPLPYAHQYTVSIIPPVCSNAIPYVSVGDVRFAGYDMLQDTVTGWYSISFTSYEGATLRVRSDDSSAGSVEQGTGNDASGYNFSLWNVKLGQDTVLAYNFAQPTIEDSTTIYYRWEGCGDNWNQTAGRDTIHVQATSPFAYSAYYGNSVAVYGMSNDYSMSLVLGTMALTPGVYYDTDASASVLKDANSNYIHGYRMTSTITEQDGVTHISAEMLGVDGNIYMISLFGTVYGDSILSDGSLIEISCETPYTEQLSDSGLTILASNGQYTVELVLNSLQLDIDFYDYGDSRIDLSRSYVINESAQREHVTAIYMEVTEENARKHIEAGLLGVSGNQYFLSAFAGSENAGDSTIDNTIYITCTGTYTMRQGSNELFVSATAEGYNIELDIRGTSLPDGVYTNDNFYTSNTWTYVEDLARGERLTLQSIVATVTTEDGVTHIHIEYVTLNGQKYVIDMDSAPVQGGGEGGEGGNTNIPDGAIVINCPSAFTWRGYESDAYFEADGDGYHVQFNIRTNNLQPGHYDVGQFWTGSYTYVLSNDGSRINSTTVSADITKRGSKTYVALTMVGTDGNTYYITMHGINPGVPYEPVAGDTISYSFNDSYYIQENDQSFYLSGYSFNDDGTMHVNTNVRFSGDVWGTVSATDGFLQTFTNSLNNQISLIGLSGANLTIHEEERRGTMHVMMLGTDSIFYEMDFNFHLPYPHTYTISVLMPTDCERVPAVNSVFIMTLDSISGMYVTTFEGQEGQSFGITDGTELYQHDPYLEEVHASSTGSWYSISMSRMLLEDTILTYDFRHPVLEVGQYDYVDTIFYKWSDCDTYCTEFAETETGYGLVVRKPYTLDASKAAALNPSSVHLYYTLPVNDYNAYMGTPDHGQLFITDSVDLHLSRFVKDDVLGRISPYQQAIRTLSGWSNDFYAGESGISSALINQGNVTADTIQQHALFVPDQWYFMALPFDAKRSDIQLGEGTFAAIRRFLPAEQAAGNYYDVWEDLAMTDTIHAGEGYIYQFYKMESNYQVVPSSAADGSDEANTWTYGENMAEALFTALPTANKQRMFVNSEQRIALKHQAATYVWNKNWNLISNPYESFYNVYNCGSNGIIAVYGGDERYASDRGGGTYKYVSLNDDYYVLQPGEAFFYQAADNEQYVTFPLAGCQMTATPDSSYLNSNEYGYDAPRAASRAAGRELYNFHLSDGTNEDRARLVINPSASMDYEVGRDALKLTPFTLTTPLFYVEDEHVQMAINERPMYDGIVYMSAQLPADGTFSIRLDETNQGQVMLLDTETGVMTDLSNGVYTFTESAGTYTRRFIISVIGNTTALQNAASGDESVMKILEDNRVFIIRGGEKYDVLGNKQ